MFGSLHKKIAARALAVALMLTVCALSTQVVAHSDGLLHDESHCTCQLCHITHAAIPQPAAPAKIEFSPRIARFTPVEQPAAAAASASILGFPRAPPA